MVQYERTQERARVLDRYPDYAVEIQPAAGHFTATIDGTVLAESDEALEVRESFHESVIYFPPDAVRMDLLERTEHATRCPFKGDASYYSIVLDSARHENAVWVYERPMPEVEALRGHLAFYTDRVAVTRGD
ncbi:MAG TPA: DUF427 domain-containing protein [Pseudomonadales bacterium]|nr:DUF427 domain-containing protein [Pseudomonadales bacterium]